MDREWLKEQLEAGRSMEDIAREVGKNPSTVAYWVNKHGLVSTRAEKHAARGPIDAEVLEDLVARGLSIRSMAELLGRSYSSVRHWLLHHGIETPRGRTLKDTAEAREMGLKETRARCPVHGLTRYIRKAGGFRCAACRQERVARHRRGLKAQLIEEAGGGCLICGYDRSPAALQFHHLDPYEKSFAISKRGMTISLAALRGEAAKCVLLCANCHAEVEAGAARLPYGGAAGEFPG